VTQHALQFIKAHHEHEIITVLKHFPGHGSSSQDSHRGWVDVTNTWKPVELKPYINLIDKTDVIMTAHVFNRSLDPEYPATLSKRIITNILRQDLHYDGVVVSDDLQMKAITSNYGFKEAIQATIEAGVDIILIGNNLKYDPNIAERTVNVINQLIAEGNITEERIDKSYQRIQQLKRRWLNEQQIRDEDVTMPVKLGKEAESFEESCAGHRLTINALPPDSTIKIMNIKPKYQPGICLKRGIYHISVTHPGYQSQKLSIRITDFDVIEPVILGR
jgi:beta-glucosidase-like glycosyl hydrolase